MTAERSGEQDALHEALAEMLYERSMEWTTDQWLSWKHVSETNRKHWLAVAATEAARLRAVLSEQQAHLLACPYCTREAQAECADPACHAATSPGAGS